MHVYIVHGYGASPSDHWFPWLKRELEKDGATVSIINLPTPSAPQPEEWQRALEAQVASIDRNTYFVAHSLGSITLLSFLEKYQANESIGGYILVSAFNAKLPILPQLDSFKEEDIDYEKLTNVARTRTVIAAIDDSIVPYTLSQRLAMSLSAKFVSVEHGNHFLGSDGFTEFPLVLTELQKAMAAAR